MSRIYSAPADRIGAVILVRRAPEDDDEEDDEEPADDEEDDDEGGDDEQGDDRRDGYSEWSRGLRPKSDPGKPLVGVNRERVQGSGHIRGAGIKDEVIDNYPNEPKKSPACQNENHRNKNLGIHKQAMPERRRTVLSEACDLFSPHCRDFITLISGAGWRRHPVTVPPRILS
jgi:hypothetical protein